MWERLLGIERKRRMIKKSGRVKDGQGAGREKSGRRQGSTTM